MVSVFAKKATSDHILIQAFPAAKKAGEICKFGSLLGFSDYTTESGAEGTVNVGKQIAVFQVTNYFGNPAIGTDVFYASDGTLTVTVTGNTLFGTIVARHGDTVDIAVTG